MTWQQLERWFADRKRQAEQHPDDQLIMRYRQRGERWSRGDHYRRKNNGIALRTFQHVRRLP